MDFVSKSTTTASNITRSVSLFDSESESISDLPALADASDCDSSDNGSFQLQLQLPANTDTNTSVSASPDRSVSSSSVRSESTTSSMNTPVRVAEFQPRIYGHDHGHGHGHNPDLSSSPSPIDAFIDASVSSSNVALASSTTTTATGTGTASVSGTVSSAPKGQIQSLDRKIMLRGCASLLCVSDLLSSAWGEAETAEAEADENNNNDENGNVVTNNGTKSKSSVSTSTSTGKLRSSSIDSITAQHIIEHNILHHMCCSEAYSYWRRDKNTQEGGSGHVDDDDDDDFGDCNGQHLPCDYFKSDNDSDSERYRNENNRMDPIQRIGNRSVCMPKKARMRLKALRESGLGRDFSSAKFSSYLQEGSDMAMNMNMDTNMAKVVQTEDEGLGMATGADHDPNTSIQHSDNDSSLYLIRQSKSLDMSKQEMQTRGKTLHSNNSNSSRSRSSNSFSYSLFQCPVNVKKPSKSTRKANANAGSLESMESMGGTGVGLSKTRTGTGTGSSSARRISNESKSTIAQRQTMATMASVPSFDSLHSEVELFYDSDPGVERTRTSTCQSSSTSTSTVTCRAKHKSKKKNKKNRNKKKTIHTHNNLNETYMYAEHAINTNNTKLSLSHYKSSMASFDLESFDMNDTALVTELIQELGSGTYTFIWHPSNIHIESSNSNSNSNTNLQKNITLPPLRTRAWFEMGSCLKKTLVQPKFVWRTIVPSSMQSSRQQSINTIQAPEFVDLLNIVRIRLPSPESIDRGIHPFVRAENSFILVSNMGDEYLFESKDEDTNRRFVLCTKLMIARLAAKIIVGDKNVFEEFFNPHGRRKMDDNKPPAASVHSHSVRVVPASEQEKTPVALGHVNSVCSTLIAPVNEESGRNDELWGR